MNNNSISFDWDHIHDFGFHDFNIRRMLKYFLTLQRYLGDFQRNKNQFLVFYLVKLNVARRSTISWCWIRTLIHINQFYNLELTEFRAKSAPTCISIPLSNLERFFKEIPIIYNLENNSWDKTENLFLSEKTFVPLSKCCLQIFWVLETKLD